MVELGLSQGGNMKGSPYRPPPSTGASRRAAPRSEAPRRRSPPQAASPAMRSREPVAVGPGWLEEAPGLAEAGGRAVAPQAADADPALDPPESRVVATRPRRHGMKPRGLTEEHPSRAQMASDGRRDDGLVRAVVQRVVDQCEIEFSPQVEPVHVAHLEGRLHRPARGSCHRHLDPRRAPGRHRWGGSPPRRERARSNPRRSQDRESRRRAARPAHRAHSRSSPTSGTARSPRRAEGLTKEVGRAALQRRTCGGDLGVLVRLDRWVATCAVAQPPSARCHAGSLFGHARHGDAGRGSGRRGSPAAQAWPMADHPSSGRNVRSPTWCGS